MRWSQLRALFLDRLAPELAGKLDVHSAKYNTSRGRTWIAFQGREIVTVEAPGFTRRVFGHSIFPELHHGRTLELGDAIYQVLHSTIEQCLASDNPLIFAMALADHRCGKRRLKALAEQSLPSVAGAVLAARYVTLGKKPPQVMCESCGQQLHFDWPSSGPEDGRQQNHE